MMTHGLTNPKIAVYFENYVYGISKYTVLIKCGISQCQSHWNYAKVCNAAIVLSVMYEISVKMLVISNRIQAIADCLRLHGCRSVPLCMFFFLRLVYIHTLIWEVVYCSMLILQYYLF
jgi:hypothetical protein